MRDCVFQRITLVNTGSAPNMSDPSWAENMHYIDNHSSGSVAAGANATTGGTLTSLFHDPVHDDFSPASGSPLRGRVREPLVPADAWGEAWRVPGSIGAVGARD